MGRFWACIALLALSVSVVVLSPSDVRAAASSCSTSPATVTAASAAALAASIDCFNAESDPVTLTVQLQNDITLTSALPVISGQHPDSSLTIAGAGALIYAPGSVGSVFVLDGPSQKTISELTITITTAAPVIEVQDGSATISRVLITNDFGFPDTIGIRSTGGETVVENSIVWQYGTAVEQVDGEILIRFSAFQPIVGSSHSLVIADDAAVRLEASLVEANQTACTTPVVDLGANFVSDASCTGQATSPIFSSTSGGGPLYQPVPAATRQAPNCPLVDFYGTARPQSGLCDSGAVELDRPPNRAPIARNDEVRVSESGTGEFNVLTQGSLPDFDQDGDELIVVSATEPQHGSLSWEPDGSMVYTPVPSFIGDDLFFYTIEDPFGLSDTAKVDIDVLPIQRCAGRPVQIFITSLVPKPADGIFRGTPGNDVVFIRRNSVTLDTGPGDDIVCVDGALITVHGGPGNDRIFGGNQIDFLYGDDGNDRIYGGRSNDEIHGGSGVDKLYGGRGGDTIHGDGGSDRIWGGSGFDTIFGGSGADRIWGGRDGDDIRGMGGKDFLYGQEGDDVIQGNWQSDLIYGGPGDDKLRGAQGKDRIYGEEGDDEMNGGDNTDYLDGGPGTDIANGQKGKDNPLVAGVSGCVAEVRLSC